MTLHQVGFTGLVAVALMASLIVTLLVTAPTNSVSAGHSFTISDGVYRVPYADGVIVTAFNDHHNHPNAPDRVDMGAGQGSILVAAASGIIRGIVDRHGNDYGRDDGVGVDGVTVQDGALEDNCSGDGDAGNVQGGKCSDYNNYVWIEHPNGEWTKYSHPQTGTVSVEYGWSVGDTILRGQALGREGRVGAATGYHLHHEVAVFNDPTNTSPFSTNGGFLQNGSNVVAFVCFLDGDTVVADNLYTDTETYTAGACADTAPTANAGGPYFVDEGSTVQLDGTGSSDTEDDILNYSWSAATNLDDASIAQPVYSAVLLDDSSENLTLTVTQKTKSDGDVTALDDEDTTTVTVENVAPEVDAVGDIIDEGGTATVSATFTDPGTLDTHTATIDWDDGSLVQIVTVAQLAAGVDHVYGDNGVFSVLVTVTDDDGGSGDDTATVTVNNANPTADIDETGTILINGVPTFLANVGDPLDFSGRSTDPGSDDLDLGWDWDDGAPTPDVTTTYLVNDPVSDPLPSPSIQPRDETDLQTHAFGEACRYDIVFDSVDDDGGAASDSVVVVIVGNSVQIRSAGYWSHQYRGNGKTDFSDEELICLLEIVELVSQVFDEETSANTIGEALDVLETKGKPPMVEVLERQLLAALLNFGNGSVAWDQLIDTDGNNAGDTLFSDVIAGAESVRLNPASTKSQLEEQKDLLEKINLGQA